MSELDTKQKVLLAFYTEYQKDVPNMRSITSSELGISNDQFVVAIQKLENEGLINGAKYMKGGRGTIPLAVITDFIMVTRDGLQYVEEKLNIQPTMTALEKTKEVSKKVTEWGYNELKDFAAKVLAEIIKG
jgi:methyl coenzyme M reductase alpha subunit